MSTQQSVVLVTGTSSGIGKSCAEHLALRGFTVFGTQRRPPTGSGSAFTTLVMDVDRDESVQQAIAEILNRVGRLDAVINNAGYAVMGSVEDTSIAEARAQLETNFFGVLRVCHAVLPIMRQQQRGRIINISSLAGILGVPFSGIYSASKFAIEGMTESLRLETRHLGIKVSLVEPGDFDTGLPAARQMAAASQTSPAYREFFAAIKAAQDKDEAVAPKPQAVAYLIEHILRSSSPRLRYSVGRLGQRIVIPLKRYLPQGLFEWVLVRALALPSGPR